MRNIAALCVTLAALQADPALQPGKGRARKLLVTELRRDKGEYEASDSVWRAELSQCPVQLIPRTELALFTHLAPQDRHYHKVGTEIYMVMSGTMVIEAQSVNYTLGTGDMIVVNPRTVHEVKPQGTELMCRVITLNCRGEKDKFALAPGTGRDLEFAPPHEADGVENGKRTYRKCDRSQ